MQFLITGGAGFIGSYFTEYLNECSRTVEVTVLDDLSSGRTKNVPDDVDFVEGDVCNSELVNSLMQDQDCCFHLAAVVGVRNALQKQIRSIETNVVGTQNVLESAKRYDVDVVITSSSAIYGKTENMPVREDDDIVLGNTHIGAWTYSNAKICEEYLARAYYEKHQVNTKIVRLFNCIGPRQVGTYGMVVPRFVEFALSNETLPVYGDGTQTRTFMDVRDALRGIELVWQQGEPATPYNLGGRDEISIYDLAETVKRLTNSRSKIKLIPYDEAFGEDFEEVQRRVPDLSKINKLGYEPKFGLDETLSWIIDHKRHS